MLIHEALISYNRVVVNRNYHEMKISFRVFILLINNIDPNQPITTDTLINTDMAF